MLKITFSKKLSEIWNTIFALAASKLLALYQCKPSLMKNSRKTQLSLSLEKILSFGKITAFASTLGIGNCSPGAALFGMQLLLLLLLLLHYICLEKQTLINTHTSAQVCVPLWVFFPTVTFMTLRMPVDLVTHWGLFFSLFAVPSSHKHIHNFFSALHLLHLQKTSSASKTANFVNFRNLFFSTAV